MQMVGNGATENGIGMVVEHLQSTYRIVYLHLAGTIQIHVENKLHFRILLIAGTLDLTGTGMELDPASAPQRQIRFHSAAVGTLLGDLLLCKGA
jgi:hypothetical protein